MRTLPLSVLCLSLVLSQATASHADAGPTAQAAANLRDPKVAAKLFTDGINAGDAQKLLALWPTDNTSVTLFGKAVKKADAQKALAAKGALYKVLRWEGPDAEIGTNATPPAAPRFKGSFMMIGSSGYGPQPLCQFSKAKTGAWKLDGCKVVDNGAP